MSSLSNTEPLACYVLTNGGGEGDRWLSETGWDLHVITQRVGGEGEIIVGVIRRVLGGRGMRRALPTPLNIARADVAMRVLDVNGIDDMDRAYLLAHELGNADDSWVPTAIEIDGMQVQASECRYEGAWAVMHLDDSRILFVVGRDSVRPINVALMEMPCEKLTDRSLE
jgi:hypothetical protein